ncbi:hypothetical protein ACHAQA_006558 [Verticillium albo-atrum]
MQCAILLGLLVTQAWALSLPGLTLFPLHALRGVEHKVNPKSDTPKADPTAVVFRLHNGTDIIIHDYALAHTSDNDNGGLSFEDTKNSISHCGGSLYESVYTDAESPLLSDCQALLQYFGATEKRYVLKPGETSKTFTLATAGTCAVKILAFDKAYVGNGDAAGILRRAFSLEFAIINDRVEASGYKYCDDCHKDCGEFRTQSAVGWLVTHPEDPNSSQSDLSPQGKDWGIEGEKDSGMPPRAIRSPRLIKTASNYNDDDINWVEYTVTTADGEDVTVQVNAGLMQTNITSSPEQYDSKMMSSMMSKIIRTDTPAKKCPRTTFTQLMDTPQAKVDDCHTLSKALESPDHYMYWVFSDDDVSWCHQGYGTIVTKHNSCVFAVCPSEKIAFGNEDARNFINRIDSLEVGDAVRLEGVASCERESGEGASVDTTWILFGKTF